MDASLAQETIATAGSAVDTPTQFNSVDDLPKLDSSGEKQEEKTFQEPEKPAVEAPAFTPNFKVKSFGKEFEIPEKFRGLIKDAESEKEVRDIFEKAFGIDGMREKNQTLREKYEALNTEVSHYKQQDQQIDFLVKCLERKDYDTYFETLQIPEKDLQEWMYQKLKMAELPNEQQRLYTDSRQSQKKLYELEMQNQQLKSTIESTTVEQQNAQIQQRERDLETVLSRQDVSSVMKAFDSKHGEGAFKNEIVGRGILAWNTQKKDLTAEEAVNQVMSLFGPAMVQASQTNAVAAVKDRPTLPIVEGKPVSPTAKKVNSVEDLRKLAQERYESE
jgi:hypothetical protein